MGVRGRMWGRRPVLSSWVCAMPCGLVTREGVKEGKGLRKWYPDSYFPPPYALAYMV